MAEDERNAGGGSNGGAGEGAGNEPPLAEAVTGAAPLRTLAEGRYRDFRKVGQGGMGIVYWALDTELNRSVAFKVVRPGAAEGDFGPTPSMPLRLSPPSLDTPASKAFEALKARFLQEAWVTGRMEHPGVVPVYEVGATPDGVPYYTMRFVRGTRTLANAIDEVDGQPIDRRLGLLEPFLKVCDTLRYAHARGVIHRDLKPENVALGEFGEVVVLDWGLARVKGAPEADGDRWRARIDELRRAADLHTEAGLLGTPGYLAPEAAKGRSGDVDERSDVYSLGAVLFRILTGRLPHRVTTLAAFLGSLLLEDPPTAQSVDPHVPAGLSRLCAEALARDPAQRIPTVEALAQRVRDWLREADQDRELQGFVRDGETALAMAEGMEGRQRIRALDRAMTAVQNARARRADHPDVRDLRARVVALRDQGMREQAGATRRRAFVRSLAVVITVAAVATSIALVQIDRRRRDSDEARATAEASDAAAQIRLAEAYAQVALSWGRAGETAAARLAAAQSLVVAPTPAGWRALAETEQMLPPARPWRIHADAAGAGVAAGDAASDPPRAHAWAGSHYLALGALGGLWELSPILPPTLLARPPERIVPSPDEHILLVSPDDRWAVGLTPWGAACSYDLEERAGRASSQLISAPLRAATWLGKDLVAVTNGSQVRVLDGASLVVLHTLDVPIDTSGLAGTRDGTRLYVANPVLGVAVLDPETGAATILLPGAGAQDLVLSQDERWLAVRGEDWVRILEVASGRPARAWHGDAWRLQAMALAPSGDLLFTRSRAGEVSAWHVGTGEHVVRFAKGKAPGRSLAVSDDGRMLATETAAWSLDDLGVPVSLLAADAGRSPVILADPPAVSPDGRLVAWVDREPSGRGVRVWDAGARRLRSVIPLEAGWVGPVALGPGSRVVFVGCANGEIRGYDVDSGRLVMSEQAHPGAVAQIVADASGDRLASWGGEFDTFVRTWSTDVLRPLHATRLPRGEKRAAGPQPHDPTGAPRRVRRLAFDAQGRRLLVLDAAGAPAGGGPWDWDGRLCAWEVGGAWSAPLLDDLQPHLLAIAPGGRALAVQSGRDLLIVDAGTLAIRRRLPVARPLPSDDAAWRWADVAISPDGRLVAALDRAQALPPAHGVHDHTLRIWSAEDGALRTTVRSGLVGSHVGIQFAPDGRSLYVASDSDVRRLSVAAYALTAAANLRRLEQDYGLRLQGFELVPLFAFGR